MIFIYPDVKSRVSVKKNDKIIVTWIFLEPIKNSVSVKSVYVEAVYLEALLYYPKKNKIIFHNKMFSTRAFFHFLYTVVWYTCNHHS
mgnify:CR=1 FL=1